MFDMLSSICILETIKYVTGWAVPTLYKSVLTFDLFDYDFKTHTVLKAPGCSVCGPVVDFSPAVWLEPVTLDKTLALVKDLQAPITL
jgi:hypothetical protein